ncbi:MAG: hypothetical protein KF703_15940 [Actinobacteria bacterium]|nr:hypothetical protein [Actinomycetota bacterium]
MDERPWRIDAGLAGDLAAALWWDPEDGAEALAAQLPALVPAGSTAKLATVARGEVPPGADVDELAVALLRHQHALESATDEPVRMPSYSCWVFTTVMAALLDWAEIGPVQVAAVRRVDDRAPVVDFHAAVVVGDGPSPLVCDPYFGTAVELPADVGPTNVARNQTAAATAYRGVDGAWYVDAQMSRWEHGCTYRSVGPALDRGDVRAFCAISATHSGVPSRGYARLHGPGRVTDLVAHVDGVQATAGSWSQDEDGQVTERSELCATWAEAVDVFAAWTGVRIV